MKASKKLLKEYFLKNIDRKAYDGDYIDQYANAVVGVWCKLIDETPIEDIVRDYAGRFMVEYTKGAPAHDYGIKHIAEAVKAELKKENYEPSE